MSNNVGDNGPPRRIGLMSRLVARFLFGVRWQDTRPGEREVK